MSRMSLYVAIVALLLAPLAGAHGSREVVPLEAGTLVALWVAPDEGTDLMDAPPLFDSPAARFAVAVPGGFAVAARDGRTLVVDVLAEDLGWHVLAIDEGISRATHVAGVAASVKIHEAVGVTAAPVPGADVSRVGTVGIFASPVAGAHDHGASAGPSALGAAAGAANAWVEWEAPGEVRGAVVERTHEATILRFAFPEERIGAGLVAGEARHLVLYHGADEGVPRGPFLSGWQPQTTELLLYPARPSETVEDLARLAMRIEGAPDLASAVGPLVGVIAFVGGAMALVAARGEWARARPVAHTGASLRPVERRNTTRALLLCIVLVAPVVIVLPAAQATIPNIPPQVLPPLPTPRDPCSSNMTVRTFQVSAIDLDIIYNRWGDHDPQGMMYALDGDISAIRAERARLQPVLEGNQTSFPNGTQPSLIQPLTLRARMGECIVIQFTNRLDRIAPPDPVDPLGGEAPHVDGPHATGLPPVPESALPLPGPEPRRASLHVHGLPLDPRVSGGDALGDNPDSTVAINRTVTYRISAAYEGVFFFHDHADPTSAGRNAFPSLNEAFRGGTVHGLFGALVIEPPGSTWTDPRTGAALQSGWAADVHTPGKPSFREFTIYYHDPQLVARDDGPIRDPSTDHGFNYRVETLSHRLYDDLDRCPPEATAANRGINPCADISLVYASNVHGDPATPIPRAYVKDKVKMRLVHAGMEETHAHHLHGHRWQAVDGDPSSTRIDSQTITPSETFTETFEAGAGGQGVAHGPGDFIFHCHLFPHLYGGMWSMFRVHDRREGDLKLLPSNEEVPPPSATYSGYPHFMQDASTPGFRPLRAPQQTGIDARTGLDVQAVGSPYFDVCPRNAPLRKYRLAAIEVPILYNRHGDYDPGARIFVLSEDADAILAGETNPDPAILRIRQGECMTITLTNRFPVTPPGAPIEGVGKVSIHTHLLEYDVLGADGTSTGWIFDQTIWQGEEITYRFYADKDLQTIVWHDHAAGLETAFKGIFGTTLVEPPQSEFRNPIDGKPIYTMGVNTTDGVFDSGRDPVTGRFSELWRADIVGPGFKDFREFFASLQDFANLRNAQGVAYRDQATPVTFDDFGLMGLNLRSEPLWHRLGDGNAITNSTRDVFSSRVHGDPSTNLWQAYAGDRTVIRVHQVAYEEIHTFQLEGHRWNFGYKDSTSPVVNSHTVGISEAFNAYLDCGAGGCSRTAGDYLYRTGGVDDVWAGGWGIFRVMGTQSPTLRPLPDTGLPRNPFGGRVCPANAPDRWFDVVAMEKELIYNQYGDHDMGGRMFVLASEEPLVRQGLLVPKPLTLRVAAGDCVHLRLTNKLPEWSLPHAHADPQPTAGFLMNRNGPVNDTRNLLARPSPVPSNHVSLHAGVLTYNVSRSDGANVGRNPDTTVAPGASREYMWYVDIPAPGAILLEDFGDVLYNRHHGLFGAIVTLPINGYAFDTITGLASWNDPSADVRTIVGTATGTAWRDFAVFVQNGVPLTNPNGLPVALPGVHQASVTASEAAVLAQAALRDALPGAAVRAHVENVGPGPTGFHVTGTLEGVPWRAEVHQREGLLVGMEFDRSGFHGSSVVRVSDSDAAPYVGLPVLVNTSSGDIALVTDAEGQANHPSVWPRGSTARVSVGPANFTTWSDSERELYLTVRANNLSLASQAGEAGLKHLRESHLPAGPLGLTGVEAVGASWRVSATDALRDYVVTLDAQTHTPIALTIVAKAMAFGPLTVVSEANATRIARQFVKTHFGAEEDLVHVALSRFGTWQVDLSRPGSATSVGVDGVTGRILYLHRGGAGSTIGPQPPDTGVVLRFRADDGTSLDGEPIRFEIGGVLVDEGTLGHGGRWILRDAVKGAERSPTRLHAILPGKGIDIPISLAPDGRVFADIQGIGASSPLTIADAVEAAHQELARLAPPGGLLLRASWGVVGVYHAPGEWRVALASAATHAEFAIDDVTGTVHDVYMRPWATPKDRCGGQPVEHGGPHPSPACRWSMSHQDEEDQGLHAYNYRTEPLENRYNRVSDAAAAYSSAVHGENGVPVWRAQVGDRVTMHVMGAGDKGRVGALSISGHVWLREPMGRDGAISQGQGGIGPGRVFLMSLLRGAAAGTEFVGDYMVQGAVQRLSAEAGEWGIFRVVPDTDPLVRRLVNQLPTPTPPPPQRNAPPTTFNPAPQPPPRMSVRVVLDGNQWTPSVVSADSIPTGRLVPVRIDVLGDAALPLRLLDIQVTSRYATVLSAVGDPVNTHTGGTFYVLLDVPATAASVTDEFVIDLVVGTGGGAPRDVGTVTTPVTVAPTPWVPPTPKPTPAPRPTPTSPGVPETAPPDEDDVDPEPGSGSHPPPGVLPTPTATSTPPPAWVPPTPEDAPEDVRSGSFLGIPTSPWLAIAALGLAFLLRRRRTSP